MVDHRTVLDIRAGPRAQAQVRDHGLAPADVVCLPAAAGGPKGLGLLPLDELLHVEFLARAPRVHLVGASIGAWRAAALAGPDPPAALRRLRHAYVRDQSYPARPSPAQVSATIRGVVRQVLDGHPLVVRPGVGLDVLTDYHLLLPYARLLGIVLYPHFAPHVTPGWLDQHLPWRRAPRAHPWLDNVLVIAPAASFVATLPNGRLPERNDFHRYGTDHASRIRDWERAIGECGRFADAAMRWLTSPTPEHVGRL